MDKIHNINLDPYPKNKTSFLDRSLIPNQRSSVLTNDSIEEILDLGFYI